MTDGGPETHPDPAREQVPWPAAPPGPWGAEPSPSSPPAPAPGPAPAQAQAGPRRRSVIEVAVVVLLTGAIVALAFTAVGGDPKETESSSGFTTIGEPLGPDVDAGTWDTIPMDEDEAPDYGDVADAIEPAMPTDTDVISLVPATEGVVLEEFDGSVAGGGGSTDCGALQGETIGGYARIWYSGERTFEVDLRVHEAASDLDAEGMMEGFEGDEFLLCATEKIYPFVVDADFAEKQIIDTSDTGSGDQRQVGMLVENDAGQRALLVWRQAGRHTLIACFIDGDPTRADPMGIDAADDLLDATATALED